MSEASAIVMPKLGLTMTEGVLASWKVAAGDAVKAGDVLFVVETEKVANDIAAEVDGRIGAILIAEGETAPVGAPVATWADAVAATPPPAASPAPSAAPPAADAAASPTAPARAAGQRIVATPLARKQAAASGVDLSRISGTGPAGRVKSADVAAALAAKPPVRTAEPAAPARPSGRRRPATSIEKTAARRLTEAKRDIPHFYVQAEADVSRLLDFRDKMNRDASGARLTLTHFVVAAVARALEESPDCNAVWRDGEIEFVGDIAVGLAVDTPRGLVAPVLRGLARVGLDALASAANRLVADAREGRLALDDFEGGAISVSNVGMFGASRLIPIVNPGQSAILGVGAVKPAFRPDAHGAPQLRQELALVLSADHRLWDGVRAARFLDAIVRRLENPLRLLR
ncbi:MAG: dihydrolipoamide acetyltransferase family protein [Roseiarcus sp.]